MIVHDPIIEPVLLQAGYQTDVLRLDQLHPEISGNKWFKLKYNLEKAIAGHFDTIITFGGAFSNHIAATAAACKFYNVKSVAVIRGDEMQALNATLTRAKDNGMELYFVSREIYSQKNNAEFKQHLQEKFGNHYLIPEGGNNTEGVLGCSEILKPEWEYDYVFCACGTATTFAGLVASAKPGQKIIGISVLKGENKLPNDAAEIIQSVLKNDVIILGNEALNDLHLNNHSIINNYCFSGYAKFDKHLVDFKIEFEAKHKFPLDHVYTAKLFYAVTDLLKLKKIKAGSKLLIIHSGGLQGNAGFEERYHLMPTL